MNPLDLINQLPLKDWQRKWIIYFVVPILVLAYGVWQASNGDWKVFWSALPAALIGFIAHAFVNTGSDTSDTVPDFDSTDDERLARSSTVPVKAAPVASSEAIAAAQANVVEDESQ